MANTYDFYKPKLSSEYPEVDGPLSVTTYIAALDAAYSTFRDKTAAAAKRAQFNGTYGANGVNGVNGLNGHVNGVNGHINGYTNSEKSAKSVFSLGDVDYALFHSPYGKQAVKGHARILYNDFLASPSDAQFANIPSPDALLSMPYAATLADKTLEKTFIGAAKVSFAKKVGPAMACSRRLGNMYTASLYGCLASLIATVEPAQLKGKRVSLFAFGSGCAASFFTLRVKGNTGEIREKMDLLDRLASMKVVPCQDFVDALAVSLTPGVRLGGPR